MFDRLSKAVVGLVVLVTCCATTTPASAHGLIGLSWLITSLPADPGFPEGVAVVGRKAYVTGPATFGNAGAAASRIYVVDLWTGQIDDELVVQGQDPNADHAAAGIAVDGDGRLYVAAVPGGVLRIDPATGGEEVYAIIPDVPPPFPGIPDLPPLVNDLAFDADGTLYVTDTLQAILWRVSPGSPGGVADKFLENPLWLGDPAACGPGGCFGLNGVRFGRDGLLYFATTALPEGTIYRVPTDGDLSDVEVFATLPPGQGPDGIAFGRSGRLYITLAFSNEIVVLGTDGSEVDRFDGPIYAPGWSTIPYDGPAVLAFHHFGLVVVNHAPATGDPAHFGLFKVFAGERGLRLNTPSVP